MIFGNVSEVYPEQQSLLTIKQQTNRRKCYAETSMTLTISEAADGETKHRDPHALLRFDSPSQLGRDGVTSGAADSLRARGVKRTTAWFLLGVCTRAGPMGVSIRAGSIIVCIVSGHLERTLLAIPVEPWPAEHSGTESLPMAHYRQATEEVEIPDRSVPP